VQIGRQFDEDMEVVYTIQNDNWLSRRRCLQREVREYYLLQC
jgi:hypothetical protein